MQGVALRQTPRAADSSPQRISALAVSEYYMSYDAMKKTLCVDGTTVPAAVQLGLQNLLKPSQAMPSQAKPKACQDKPYLQINL